MAITRAQKEAQIEALVEELQQAKMTVLVAYSGMSVPHAQQLRARLHETGGSFRVVKNAMFFRAVSQAFDGLDISDIEGPIAIATSYDDEVAPAQVVSQFNKEYEVLHPIGAIDMHGQRFSADQVEQLAILPTREQLTGQLVGTIAAPLTGFVTVLSGNLRGLVTVLDAAAQKQQ